MVRAGEKVEPVKSEDAVWCDLSTETQDVAEFSNSKCGMVLALNRCINTISPLISSAKEFMFSPILCSFAFQQDFPKTDQQISMKFSWRMRHGSFITLWPGSRQGGGSRNDFELCGIFFYIFTGNNSWFLMKTNADIIGFEQLKHAIIIHMVNPKNKRKL